MSTLWQRRARTLIGLSGLAFGLLVFAAIRDREEGPAGGAIDRLDPEAVVESTGAVVTQARGATSHFTVEAARQLTYAGGLTRLEEVTVTILERAGRDFVVTGREAEVGPDSTTVTITGDVRLTASDGLTVHTERAAYDDTEGLLRAPGRLSFERGTLSGSGVGATYDRDRDVLRLLDEARIRFGAAGAATAIASGSAALARADHYATFEGGVRLEREGRTMSAEQAVAHLSEDGLRLRVVELRGGAHMDGAVPGMGPGALEAMRSDDMNLIYGEDGESVERATLVGGATIELSGAEAARPRRISADRIDVTMAPATGIVSTLLARTRVVLDLPGETGAAARQVRAATLDASGDDVRGLTLARFAGDVDYLETPPGSRGSPRTIRSDALDLALAPGFGAVEQARFRGRARFREEGLSAAAPEIVYAARTGLADLSAPVDTPGAGPTVTDGRFTVDARAIALTPEARQLRASGEVRSLFRGADSTDDGPDEVKMPGILTGDQPVYISGEDLVYDGAASVATYTGTARLWQGETAVQGDRLTLDGAQGNLTAEGSVRSTMALTQTEEETGDVQRVNTVATAAEFLYEEAHRRATYVTAARVNGPQGDLTASRVELFLDGSGGELDRAEAYEAVTLRDDRRTATGDRLSYRAGDGRYTMHGAPVSIIEACRETTGQTLTFYRSTDTITVDGNQEIRTQTRTGGGCP